MEMKEQVAHFKKKFEKIVTKYGRRPDAVKVVRKKTRKLFCETFEKSVQESFSPVVSFNKEKNCFNIDFAPMDKKSLT